jgi:hypothetical protein
VKLADFARSPAYCGLELSPLAAAVMDASEGIVPTTIDDAAAVAHFGCPLAELPTSRRRTVCAETGGRAGKTSRLQATKALHAAWTVALPTLRRGEVASSLLIAPDLKLARQALSFVVGYVEGSRILTRALVEAPTKDGVELRRPDGKRVRVEVLAASRGGRGVRGRTLVFAGLDEACFFFDEQSGVVNDADIFRAVAQRVAPGGQVWITSTPWLADVGLLETLIAKNWGTHANALVMRAGTRALNPTWDPTGEIERDLREQDPDAAVREIDGQPMTGGAGVFFDAAAITACIDETLVLPLDPAGKTAFGVDLGFVNDSSALVGATMTEPVTVAVVEELRPRKGAPLKPSEVTASFATTIRRYGADAVVGDGHYKESAKEGLSPHGIDFVDAPAGRDGKTEAYLNAKKLIHERRVRLPNLPRLLSQLRQIVSRPAPGGGLIITSPKGRGGGGHGDVASALVNALWQAKEDAEPPFVTAMRAGRAAGFFHGYGGPPPPKPAPRAIPDHVEDVEKTSAWEHKKDGGSEWGKLANLLAGGEEPREKPPGTVEVDIGPGGGRCTGTGVWYSMRATWQGRSGAAEFSANASSAFRAEVLKKAIAAGHVIT